MTTSRFDIFEDVNGLHYVLLEAHQVQGIWLAFILESSSLCYRAGWNLDRMKKVGHAGLETSWLYKSELATHAG